MALFNFGKKTSKPLRSGAVYEENIGLPQLIRKRWEASEQAKNSAKFAMGNIQDYIWRNVQNKNEVAMDDDSRVFINKSMEYIENLCSLANSQDLMFEAYPQLPGFDIDSHIYQQSLRWVANQNKDIETARQADKFAMLKGTGIFKVWYEEFYFGGNKVPGIKYTAIDTAYVMVDPLARNSKEISYVIEICFYTKGELKKLYPDYNDDSTGSVSEQTNDYFEVFNTPEMNTEFEMVKVWEMWDQPSDKDKYPFGRTSICTENQTLLEEPCKYECGHQFVFQPCIDIPDRVYGRDYYTYIRDMQDFLNGCFKRIEKITKKTSNGDIVVNPRSGINPDSITNKDGQIFTTDKTYTGSLADAVYPLPQAQLSPALLDMLQITNNYIKDFCGVQDISMGRAQINSGMPSGASLERLEEASQTRLRQFVYNKTVAKGYLGEKIVSIIHQFFDAESVVRISGSDAQTIKQVWEREKMMGLKQLMDAGANSPEEIDKGMNIFQFGKGVKLDMTDEKNTYLTYKGTNLGDPTVFQIRIEGGVDVPRKKLDIAASADLLLREGRIDIQSYFEMKDIQGMDKILQRLPDYLAFQRFKEKEQQFAIEQQNAMKAVQRGQMRDQLKNQPLAQIKDNGQGGVQAQGQLIDTRSLAPLQAMDMQQTGPDTVSGQMR